MVLDSQFIDRIGESIGMMVAKEYNQLMTCHQYLKIGDQGKKEYRLKIYNKFVHLLTCGQYKKKINMALNDLLLPGISFY